MSPPKAPAAPISLPRASASSAAAAAAAAALLASRRAPVPSGPERVLDAPDLVDDFYLNLLSWSSGNTLAVGLGRDVYLWKASDGTVSVLNFEAGGDGAAEGDYVSSVSWAGDGRHVAVGVARAGAGRAHEVQLWDAAAGRQLRSLRGHAARVASLAWSGSTLSSGGRDSLILNHDVRARQHVAASLSDGGHSAEVCGLSWDRSGRYLASGGNDNVVCVWEPSSRSSASAAASSNGGVPTVRPRHRFTDHCAAVKALAWCPFQPAVLASGGGAADRSIRTWNAHTGAALSSVDAGAQVTALTWAPLADGSRELLSAHGYSSAPGAPSNGLAVWKYPSLTRVATVGVAGVSSSVAAGSAANAAATNGAGSHGARVLHMATSPDGRTVATAAADETLRFWRVFGGDDGDAASASSSSAAASASIKAKGGSGLPRQGSMAAVTVR